MSAPIAISIEERTDYVLRGNREDPDGERVTFVLRSLTAGEQHAVSKKMAGAIRGSVGEDEDGTTVLSLAEFFDACRLAVEHGLVGWRGLRDKNGSEVAFPANARQACERQLAPSVVQELGHEVMRLSKLTGEQRRD